MDRIFEKYAVEKESKPDRLPYYPCWITIKNWMELDNMPMAVKLADYIVNGRIPYEARLTDEEFDLLSADMKEWLLAIIGKLDCELLKRLDKLLGAYQIVSDARWNVSFDCHINKRKCEDCSKSPNCNIVTDGINSDFSEILTKYHQLLYGSWENKEKEKNNGGNF